MALPNMGLLVPRPGVAIPATAPSAPPGHPNGWMGLIFLHASSLIDGLPTRPARLVTEAVKEPETISTAVLGVLIATTPAEGRHSVRFRRPRESPCVTKTEVKPAEWNQSLRDRV